MGGLKMKLTQHELMLFCNEDYRENVLGTLAGQESAEDILNEVNNGK